MPVGLGSQKAAESKINDYFNSCILRLHLDNLSTGMHLMPAMSSPLSPLNVRAAEGHGRRPSGERVLENIGLWFSVI